MDSDLPLESEAAGIRAPEPVTSPTTTTQIVPPETATMPRVPAPVALPPPLREAEHEPLFLDEPDEESFDVAESTLKRAKLLPLPPPSWLELADPGLESLTARPSPTAALLDGILSQPGASRHGPHH
jgi:hypothetical protein